MSLEEEREIARDRNDRIGGAIVAGSQNAVQRATTSKVFGILFISFLINATAKYNDKKGKKSSGGAFATALITSNLPAWAILLIIMTFLADNPTTGQVAYGIAILIFLSSIMVNGEQAVKNMNKITESWGKK